MVNNSMVDKIIAEKGVIIGVQKLDSLSCPVCNNLLEWIEHKEDGKVKLNKDGLLVPEYEDKLEIGRASVKEAFCCGIFYKARPWATYVISTDEDDA
jgi:uncharacterized protein YbaR (Trm112 family)